MKELHGNRIEAKVKENMEEKRGSPVWLAIYAKAAAEIAAQLSGEEREEVNDLVERWNTQGLPEEKKK